MDRPPRLSEWVLGRLLHPDDRSDALGDLAEEYRMHVKGSGLRAARRWYRSQLFRSVGPSIARRRPRLPGIGSDLRVAVRGLRRAPGRSAVLIGVLALGIGAGTAIFSVVDQVLFRPLPYPEADRLHSVWNVYPDWEGDEVLDYAWDQVTVSWPEYVDIRDGNRTLEAVAAYGFSELVLTEPGNPSRVMAGFASDALFALLGTRPVIGRVFAPGEDGPSAPSIALITHGFWVDRMGRDPAAVGSTLRIEDRPFEIVGVLPPDFRLRGQSPFGAIGHQDIWLPLGTYGAIEERGNRSYEVLARTSAGATASEAGVELTRLVWGEGDAEGRRVQLTPRHAEEVARARVPLLMLLGSALLLLTIVGANVTTLRIGSVAAREREWATRAALGGGRGQLRRLLLVESLVIGGLGCLGGGVLGWAVIRALVSAAEPALLMGTQVAVDARALAFGGGIGLLVAIVAGLIPLTRMTEGALSGMVGRTGVSQGRAAGLLQRGLVVTQVAVSLVLLCAAGLFLRSLDGVASLDPGFHPGGVVTLEVAPSQRSLGSPQGAFDFHERVAARMEAIPGVEAVGATSYVPFGGGTGSNSFEIGSRPAIEGERSPEGLRRNVRPGFFELLEIPVLEGRTFQAIDGPGDPLVAVVSRAMADAYWQDRSPIGDEIVRLDRRFEIVGIVGDVTRADLTADPEPTFYVSLAQEPVASLDVLVRVDALTPAVAEAMRQAVWAEDPGIPLPAIIPLTDRVRASMRAERVRSLVAAFFGAVAALLVALGLFGVAMQGVVHRTREIGVRMALGASAPAVERMMVRRELRVVWLGIGIGVGLVLLVGRALAGVLYRVSPTDPVALLGAAAALTLVALVAVWLPARRAARLDPVEVLAEG